MKLKYKVWDKTSDKMLNSNEHHIKLDLTNKVAWIAESPINYEKEIEAVILPYTGVKDANGKEIYLGDIVELKVMKDIKVKGYIMFDRGVYEIKYEEKTFGRISEPLRVWASSMDNRCELIGNIYQNKELIK